MAAAPVSFMELAEVWRTPSHFPSWQDTEIPGLGTSYSPQSQLTSAFGSGPVRQLKGAWVDEQRREGGD